MLGALSSETEISNQRQDRHARTNSLRRLANRALRGCGEEAECVEPDARHYKCEACGQRQVFGAPEILLHMI